MSFGRAASAVVVTIALAAGAVGSSAAVSNDDGDGKPSWKRKSADSKKAPSADQIALDRLGDADRGVDIQSLAVFNRKNLDFVGLAITGRDFRLPTKRSVEVLIGTGKRAEQKPRYRLIATNDGPGHDTTKVRLYRVKGWTSAGEKRVKCGKMRVQFDIESQSQIRVAVPRSCMSRTRKGVSANATVWGKKPVPSGEQANGNDTDIVPDKFALTRRVG